MREEVRINVKKILSLNFMSFAIVSLGIMLVKLFVFPPDSQITWGLLAIMLIGVAAINALIGFIVVKQSRQALFVFTEHGIEIRGKMVKWENVVGAEKVKSNGKYGAVQVKTTSGDVAPVPIGLWTMAPEDVIAKIHRWKRG